MDLHSSLSEIDSSDLVKTLSETSYTHTQTQELKSMKQVGSSDLTKYLVFCAV